MRAFSVLILLAACGSTGMPAASGPDGASSGGAEAGIPPADTAPAADQPVARADGPSPAGPDAPAGACAFDRSYEFFHDGGLRLYQDRSRLIPPTSHGITRDRLRGAPLETCTRLLPCATVDALTRAIAHPDVVEAMKQATRPHYGGDPRPVDGTIFVFQRDDGRGFSVGPGNVPAGVRALEQALLKVLEDSLASAECAALK